MPLNRQYSYHLLENKLDYLLNKLGLKRAINHSFFTQLATHEQRLMIALIVAVLLHAIILSIQFVIEPVNRPSYESLDIILNPLNSDQQEPIEADYLAQSSQQGGGSMERNMRTTNVLSQQSLKKTVKQKKQLNESDITLSKQKQSVISVDSTSLHIVNKLEKKESLAKQERKEKQFDASKYQYLSALKQQIVDLEADLDVEANAYAKNSKKKFVNASTSKSHDAEYIKKWSKRIEQEGNKNYPKQVKAMGLSGRLILSVTINKKGKVLAIDILQSSQNKILDQAAIDIVKQSAPFPVIPKRVLLDNNSLVITRTWVFSEDEKLLSAH